MHSVYKNGSRSRSNGVAGAQQARHFIMRLLRAGPRSAPPLNWGVRRQRRSIAVQSSFSFDDLHAFKDFIVFVGMCAPDSPRREGVPDAEQWNLDLAFEGLSAGLAMARKQRASASVILECQTLFRQALEHYRSGRKRDGFEAMEKARRAFRRIRTQ
jgi:hypothetical protein